MIIDRIRSPLIRANIFEQIQIRRRNALSAARAVSPRRSPPSTGSAWPSVTCGVFWRKMVDRNEEVGAISSASTSDPEDVRADEQQQARAFLRERFLRVVTGIVGKEKLRVIRSRIYIPLSISMYDSIDLQVDSRHSYLCRKL